jgi:hypothetical protein
MYWRSLAAASRLSTQRTSMKRVSSSSKMIRSKMTSLLQSEGEPLWDGDADLLVRDPFPEEQAYWQASQARAIKDGEIEDRDDTWLLFLVPVTDPTDDEV